MEKIGRERRSESVWREIVARQAESGLTVHAAHADERGKSSCWSVARATRRTSNQPVRVFRLRTQ